MLIRALHIAPLLVQLVLAACAGLPVATGETVEHVERRRFAAMVAQDVAALEPLLAEELHYVHSTGQVETKSQFLETIRTGRIRYESINVRELKARLYQDVGLVSGHISVSGRAGGQAVQLELRFTDAHVWRDGRWQLVTWQTTRVPGPQ